MGMHTWTDKCPYCGFEEMFVSADNNDNFEIACQICGYTKWTEEKIPDNKATKFAVQTLSKMDEDEKQKAIDLFNDDRIPLVVRLGTRK